MCSFLDDPEDLTNFRCACKLFADFGLPASLREITIYPHRYHLDKLEDLSNDLTRSKYVKSIVLVPYNVINTGERVSQPTFERIRREFRDHPSNPLRKFSPTAPDRQGISSPVDGQSVSDILAEVLPKLTGLRRLTFRPLSGLLHTLKYYPRASETVSSNKPFHWDIGTSMYLSPDRDWNDGGLGTCANSRDYLVDRVKYRGGSFQLPALEACAKQLSCLTIGPISPQSIAKIAAFCKDGLLSGLKEIRIEVSLGVKGQYNHAAQRTEVLKGDMRDFFTAMPNLQIISLHFTVLPLSVMAGCAADADETPIVDFGEIFKSGYHWPALREISMTGIALDKSWMDFANLHGKTLRAIELFSFFLSEEYPNMDPKPRDDTPETDTSDTDVTENDNPAIDHELVPNFFKEMRMSIPEVESVIIYGRIHHPSAATVNTGMPPEKWNLGTPWQENRLREDLSSYLAHRGDEHPLRPVLPKVLPLSQLVIRGGRQGSMWS